MVSGNNHGYNLGTDTFYSGTVAAAREAALRGVPAIAVGVTEGSGEHTAQEWIRTGPIEAGLRALARTIERFEELSA